MESETKGGLVKTISASALASLTIGGNVTYRPGSFMIKIQSDPKVYAVGKGGVLRWVKSAAVAQALYGTNWTKKIHDLSDAFFINYKKGLDIENATLFDPTSQMQSASTISADKEL